MKSLYPSGVLILLLFLFAFNACSPSFPKDKITVSVEEIIKKEYNLDGEAKIVGNTLFLDIKLQGLITTEADVLSKILENIQGAVLAVTRVTLSSDARVGFIVVSANDASWKLSLRIIQRTDDVKGYLYQRISRSDYSDRLVLEINNNIDDNAEKPGVDGSPLHESEMEMKEFVGRLIVSHMNMLSRSNPFLTLLLGNSNLKYQRFNDDELVLSLREYLDPKIVPLFEDIFKMKALNISSKFKEFQLNNIRILGEKDQVITIKMGFQK